MTATAFDTAEVRAEDRIALRQRVFAESACPPGAYVLVPQREWRMTGPVCWRLLWGNHRRVLVQAWPMAEPRRPPYAQWFEGDTPTVEVDVYDYEGARIGTHSYAGDIERDRRDMGCGWTYRPEIWFWETRPVYPYHWHVFILREVASVDAPTGLWVPP